MEIVKQIENMVARWLKPLPHLPGKGQKWLADNVWWITLVGVIISTLGTLSLIGVTLAAMALIGATSGFLYLHGYAANYVAYTGWGVLWLTISIILLIAMVVIMAMAVGPLKEKKSKGWELLFLSTLLSAVFSIFNLLARFDIFNFISGLIFSALAIAIGVYFLFEIKSHFKSTK